jgi:predicted nucleic acid-binding protein
MYMTAKFFADTNIVIYAQENDRNKSMRAIAIMKSSPLLSAQVILETINTLTVKFGLPLEDAHDIALSILTMCDVVPITIETILQASSLVERYRLSHWDSTIVAAALLAECEILYTEDLHHGMVFEGKLRVINPFVH